MTEKKQFRARRLSALFISRMPFNFLRVHLYRTLCGYQIHPNAKIGYGTVVAVDQARIGQAEIGKRNLFEGPFSLEIADAAFIGMKNTFECGQWALEERFAQAGYLRHCKIGRETLIAFGHYIDTIGGFEIKEKSWIAGRDSQFWTHGAGAADRSVTIGSETYIGSAVRFAPGSGVGNCCLVGLGSVVTGRFAEDRLFIGGFPARIIRSSYDWKKQNL